MDQLWPCPLREGLLLPPSVKTKQKRVHGDRIENDSFQDRWRWYKVYYSIKRLYIERER